ncbi:HGR040Cp [Eremothecium sinecaudum]|uniref:HGR040Cp n=1 Tax=Eremothecium sinecaudum TaxID=45286 RepID=A0A0X8HVP3_9SACH|nr:HGR040Cp [Eremothecium sinecaudum]AMD22379.1 HGR040Cp [Eremothecium sinecaudum]
MLLTGNSSFCAVRLNAFPLTRTLFTTPRCQSWFSKLIYPPASTTGASSYAEVNINGPNKCFLPIRNYEELNETLLYSHTTPLILNFTFRGHQKADELTGALNKIVLYETERRINICDVEMDFINNREGVMRFGVTEIPTLVSVRKTLPVDYFCLSAQNGYVNWLQLKAWIEKNADKP